MARQIQAADTLGVPTATFPTFGTLGVVVKDSGNHNYAMSCTHVVAAPNNPNSALLPAESPSTADLPKGANIVGKVWYWIPYENGTNFVDAGLVLLDPAAVQATNAPLGLAAGQYAMNLKASDYLLLAGRPLTVFTSRGKVNVTAGQVYGDVPVELNRKQYSFSWLLSYTATSGDLRGGDSGAAVVDDATGQFLGLHMAGPGGGLGYCCIAPLIWQDFPAYSLSIAP